MAASRPAIGEEYLSQVAHELRGSLNAILGWAEFLRRTDCDEPSRVRAAETIIRHARQQSAMLSELLDTWRLASGTLALNISPFALRPLVDSAIDAVRPAAQARSVQVECRDETDGLGRARGDPRRLAQALVALLANAVHFAPEDSTVEVSIALEDGAARVVIRDGGPAVAAAALPYLFDRNRPAGRMSPRGSFRLGLGFARDVIVRHGGSIEAESAGETAGVTFRVALPLEPAQTPAGPEVLLGEATGEFAGAQLGGLRVLLVDDEPDAREALMGILQFHGAVVRAAASAADAIAALQLEEFDVLLADIGMPGADGYDLIRYVRRLEARSASRVPAAAVTAFSSDADRRRALDAGYQVHLSKPVDPAALVATVAVLGRPSAPVR